MDLLFGEFKLGYVLMKLCLFSNIYYIILICMTP